MRERMPGLLLVTVVTGALLGSTTVVSGQDAEPTAQESSGALHVRLSAPQDADASVRLEVDGLSFVVDFDPEATAIEHWVRIGGLEPGPKEIVTVDESSGLEPTYAHCMPHATRGSPGRVQVVVPPGTTVECEIRYAPQDATVTVTPVTGMVGADGIFSFLDVPGSIDDLGLDSDEGLDTDTGLDGLLGLLENGLAAGAGPFSSLIPSWLYEQLTAQLAALGGPWPVEADTPTSIGARPPGLHTIILAELEPGFSAVDVACTADGKPIVPVAASSRAVTLALPSGADMACDFGVRQRAVRVSPVTTPPEATGTFAFASVPAEVLGGFSFLGATIPGLSLEEALASPDLAAAGTRVEANETGILPEFDVSGLSGQVIVVLHELPPGFVARSARCLDGAGTTLVTADVVDLGAPAAIAVDTASYAGITCTFEVERLADATVNVIAATDPADASGTFTFIDLPGSPEGFDGSLEGIEQLMLLLEGGLPRLPAGFGSITAGPLDALYEEFAAQLAAIGGPWPVEADTPTTLGPRTPGAHTLILAELEPGFTATGVSCSADHAASTPAESDPTELTPELVPAFEGVPLGTAVLSPRAVTLELSPGADVTCTFEVTLTDLTAVGDQSTATAAVSLDFQVEVLPSADAFEGSFELIHSALGDVASEPRTSQTLAAGEHVTIDQQPAGDHAAQLILVTADGVDEFQVSAHLCVADTGATLAEATGSEADLVRLPDLVPGETVACRFEVRRSEGTSRSTVLAPKPGRWRAVNAASQITCAGFTTPLPRTTDNGRIQLKQNGRRIIATGIGDGARIVLDQVEGKPGLYRGSARVRSQGVTMPIVYEWLVVDPEHIKGTLRADFKTQGQKCTIARDLTGTFRGR